jgi:periplasmic protein TonB
MPVGLPPTPTPPQPPQPTPPPPPPPPPVVTQPDPTTTNQNEDVEDAAGPAPEETTPRRDGVTLPNETPQLHPPPGGTVHSGKPSIDERA